MNTRMTAAEMVEHLTDAHQRIQMIWTALPQEIRDQCGVHIHACIDIARDMVAECRAWRDASDEITTTVLEILPSASEWPVTKDDHAVTSCAIREGYFFSAARAVAYEYRSTVASKYDDTFVARLYTKLFALNEAMTNLDGKLYE